MHVLGCNVCITVCACIYVYVYIHAALWILGTPALTVLHVAGGKGRAVVVAQTLVGEHGVHGGEGAGGAQQSGVRGAHERCEWVGE